MSDAPAAPVVEVDQLDETQWVVVAASRGQSVRFRAPVEIGEVPEGVWVEVRPLTHREALERESLGAYEEYELAESGRVVRGRVRGGTVDLVEALSGLDFFSSLPDSVERRLEEDAAQNWPIENGKNI